MEISKVRVDLHHPIWLDQDDSSDEYPANRPREERFDFHPGDDIMERP